VIDLIYKTKSGAVKLIDYKTDKTKKDYGAQEKVYAVAVERVMKIKDPEVQFVFLRDLEQTTVNTVTGSVTKGTSSGSAKPKIQGNLF
jgi:hypothetical protein